jgi:hypothetical protein
MAHTTDLTDYLYKLGNGTNGYCINHSVADVEAILSLFLIQTCDDHQFCSVICTFIASWSKNLWLPLWQQRLRWVHQILSARQTFTSSMILLIALRLTNLQLFPGNVCKFPPGYKEVITEYDTVHSHDIWPLLAKRQQSNGKAKMVS